MADAHGPTDQTKPAADSGSPVEGQTQTLGDRPFWSMNRDEQRLLWITFLGGLGSIVIGAGIVGLSIALARSTFRQHPRPVTILFFAGVCVIYGMLIGIRNDPGFRAGGRRRILGNVASVVFAIGFAVFFLALMGVAAGY
jgi:hypothetical protein